MKLAITNANIATVLGYDVVRGYVYETGGGIFMQSRTAFVTDKPPFPYTKRETRYRKVKNWLPIPKFMGDLHFIEKVIKEVCPTIEYSWINKAWTVSIDYRDTVTSMHGKASYSDKTLAKALFGAMIECNITFNLKLGKV